ncbi:MAG: flagellar basal body-associated FliL family protein [Anaerolineae bacterium]
MRRKKVNASFRIAAISTLLAMMLVPAGCLFRKGQPEGAIVEVGKVVTNLAEGSRLAQVCVAIETEAGKTEEIARNTGRIRHLIISAIRAKSAGDLAGSDGMARLARDIADRIAAELSPGLVWRVYITDLVVD